MLEFEQIVKTTYWIILGIILVILITRILYFFKTKSKRIKVTREENLFKIIRYVTILILPIFLFGVTSFVFVLQKGNMFAPGWMKTTLLMSFFLILISEVYYNLRIKPEKLNRIFNSIFLFSIGIIGLYLTNLFLQANTYPSVNRSVIVEVPFKGKWIATGAGATGLTNHHDRIRSQKYAIDIARVGSNGKLFTGRGIEKEESNTYGSEVLSPVNGEVVWIVDTLPDSPIKERDKLAGNHIVIKFQDTLYVALAHLQPKSIPHKIGDRISIGDYLGKVGMSGNTDFCHLHIHIQDRPQYDIDNGRSYPIRFKEFKKKRYVFWDEVENDYLLSNDMIEK